MLRQLRAVSAVRINKLWSAPPARFLDRFRRYTLIGGEKAVRIPVGIVVSGLTSRALGVEDFGLFCSVMVMVTVLSPVASFGLESLGIALAAKSAGAAPYIRSIAVLRLATGVIASLVFLLASTTFFGVGTNHLAAYALYALSAIFVIRIYELGENVLFAHERLIALASIRGVAFVTANAAIVVVLLLHPDLSLLLALNAIEATLLLIGYAVVLRADVLTALRPQAQGNELQLALQQCRAAFPVFISGMLVLILLNVDKLLVYRFLDKSQVGLYCSAAKLVDVLYFIPMVIGTVHAASFARLAHGGELLSAYRTAFSTATWVSFSVALLLVLFSGVVMPTLFGAPFAAASRTLALLAPGLVAVTWVSLRTRALAAMDRRREILMLTVIAFAIHVPMLAIGLLVGSIEAVAICQTMGWIMAAAVVPLLSPVAGMFSPVRMLWNPR
jgi:O-antigen/teichoic acid export membrane protein